MGELLRMMVQSCLPKSSLQKFPVAEIFLCAARLDICTSVLRGGGVWVLVAVSEEGDIVMC